MAHDDFQTEPVRGLPEVPPEGEKILWQGRPDWRALLRDALAFRWVTGYFALLALWRFIAIAAEGSPGSALGTAAAFGLLALATGGLLALTAWIQARATVYTITNRRVAMRIGAALTVTLNLPHRQIGDAVLDLRGDGTGTIAFRTIGDTRLSYLVCWPHVRPLVFATEPALRAIPDAARVAEIFADAAEARVSEPKLARHPAAAIAAE